MTKRKQSAFPAIGVMIAISLVLAGCGSGSGGSNGGSGNGSTADKYPVKNLTIAAQDYSEAVIDDNILAQLIEAKTPIKVTVKSTSGASMLMHTMLKQGDIQLYTGYDGTEFQEIYKQSYVGKYAGHPNLVLDYVKKQEASEGIWTSPSFGYQDTYALAVNDSTAKDDHLKTVSDTEKYVANWNVGTDTTFPNLDHTGLPDFEQDYGLHFRKVTSMSYDLLYQALAKHSVDAIIAYSTDGRLKKLHEVPLTDDKNFFPPYNSLVLVKSSILKQDHLAPILKPLWGAISVQDQIQMNYDVDVLKQDPAKVARNFLVKKGFIQS